MSEIGHFRIDATPWKSIEAARKTRNVEVFITDYLPDDKSFGYKDRVLYYCLLKDQLGISSVRTEFRMKDLLDRKGNLVEETVSRYRDCLKAMKEAELPAPALVLFTPAKWMYEVAKADPPRFLELYGKCAERIAQLCSETDVAPARVQVMNEVNTQFQTKVGIDMTVKLIQKSAEVFKPDFPETKIITTVLTAPKKNWQNYTTDLLAKAGSSLDGIGFDYYPGTYEYPAGLPIIGKKPYEAYAGITPYPWIAKQKIDGILKNKEVILAEIGVPALFRDLSKIPIIAKLGYDYRQQQFGYDRIIHSLDRFFLDLELQGTHAHDVFSAIGFFQGGKVEGVNTKAPGGIDFFPWTLMRKNESGQWQTTDAGRRLKHLISTRLKVLKS